MEQMFTRRKKMIKGHLQIDLHNHNSGFTERYEQDNLVTNAISRYTPCQVSAGVDLAANLLPLYQRGLGAVYLFDQALTSNANNVLFPAGTMEHPIKLVGCAGQTQNTNEIYGSLNNAETHLDSNRSTVSVWDFATHQANGFIRSIALSKTHRWVNHGVNPFHVNLDEYPHSHYGFLENGNAVDGRALWYEDNYFYFMYSETDDGTTHKAKIYKQYRPMNGIKVADGVNAWAKEELIDEIEFDTDVPVRIWDMVSVDNSTRTVYFTYITASGSGVNGKFKYRTIDIDELVTPGVSSITVSAETEIEATDVHFRTPAEVYDHPVRICGGYAYVASGVVSGSNDVRKICIIDMLDPTNLRDVAIPGSGYLLFPETYFGALECMPSGGIRIFYYTYQIPTPHYSAYRAILYPDGSFVKDTPYYVGDEYSMIYPGQSYPVHCITDSGILIRNYPDTNIQYGRWISFLYPDPRYLGTICNLSQAINKTSSTSMKVTYTLTDATS